VNISVFHVFAVYNDSMFKEVLLGWRYGISKVSSSDTVVETNFV